MHWTEPATSEDSHAELEKNLWDAGALAEIEAQGWSLNPDHYVGVPKGEDLKEKLEVLNNEARELEARIAENVSEILEA